MDGRAHNGGGGPERWSQGARSSTHSTQRNSPEGDGYRDRNNRATDKDSRPNVYSQNTIRTVTPEPAENGNTALHTTKAQPSHVSRGYDTTSPQTSPRSIPGGERRRQGMVFNDAFGGSYDSSESSPPQHTRPPARPRTHTMDAVFASRQQTGQSVESRHRVGSFSSSSSTPFIDNGVRSPQTVLESAGFKTSVSATSSRAPDLKISVSTSLKHHEKKSANKRLIKRASSRPTSPLISPPPSVDSLPVPIATDDANRVLLLMKTLCGRMKGEVEYQGELGGPWYSGVCYIDEERGSLLFDSGQNGPFHIPLVGDLRGCRVMPVESMDGGGKCLELLLNHKTGVEVLLRPLIADEFDLWLAALLCWQQLQPSGVRVPSGRFGTAPSASRAEMRRRGSSVAGSSASRDTHIIKVGKVMLWDKGTATSPRAIVKRPSTRDLRAATTAWVRVSCILQNDGEFKLMTENDVTILSVIELSQLSRCAVQQLDKSVLDEDYCIAIFPIYASTAKQLSIFRPVYLALDTRVLFEVWFVLLRAYAVPDLYGIEPTTGQAMEITSFDKSFDGQMFRLEKTIQVRVTEAKLKRPDLRPEQYDKHDKHDRHHRNDRDPLMGNYLAEVILDGEVRARTTTQTDTSKPFWREAVQFTELSSSLPYLSVVLKRVDGNLESLGHQLQASLGLPKTGNLTEVMCGAVDIPLDKLEHGKDDEQWHQIQDEKNESIGSMFVKVNMEEFIVLQADDYKPLSDLLHKLSLGLPSQIAAAMPQQLRRLAEIFINIFQASTKSFDWLLVLVEDEIDGIGGQNSMKKMRFSRRIKSNESAASATDREFLVRDMGKSLAGEANLLFRGNTLLTQALEFHMRRLGKEYLEDVLTDKIFEINEINPDCEVDPSRIQHHIDVGQHWSQLMQLTTEVWQCIVCSAKRLPAELRHILKYIRAVAEDRYGDFLRTVAYTSVSGFLFLRFICPAILNPKLFGLLRDNPRPKAQRTLTLVAKGLQALGNLSTFGKKESWMEPMNKFLNNQRQPFKDFVDQVCSIPAERAPVPPPPTYTTPTTILGRLPKPAREGFPVLPYLVDDARYFAALVKLWLEAHHINAADSHTFGSDLAEFHELCIGLQRRADQCMTKIEVIRASESLSLATDDMTDSLEKTSLLNSMQLAYGSSSIWTENDPYRAPGSSGSDAERQDRSRSYETRFSGIGREHHPHRQASDSSEVPSLGGTLRRNGKNPRTFLSGLIGGKKDKHGKGDGPSPGYSTGREKSRDKEDKKGFLGGLAEGWPSSENPKH